VTHARLQTVGGDRPLRGVVVGAGFLGPYWVRELQASPDTELVGWVDVDDERLRARAAELKLATLPLGTDLDEMLAAHAPDFVVNVTAPLAHHAITTTALRRGAAVLSEKPLAMSMEEARDMVAVADAAQRLLMVSQNRRYMPSLVAFRETVARLGTLSSLTCDFYIAHRKDHDSFITTLDEPLLFDMAIHLFDAARAVTGADPVSVYCESYAAPWDWFAGASSANALFQMTGDLRFAFSGSWCADGFQTSWTGRWRAIGERGSAVWDGLRAPRAQGAPGAALEAVRPASVQRRRRNRFEGLADALGEFVAALRTGRVPQGECHDNLRSLAMCHAAVASARAGAPTAVVA
jgi:predicted dehydrogenase